MESSLFVLPQKRANACHSESEQTLQLKRQKLDSMYCVTEEDSPSSDNISSCIVSQKLPLANKHKARDLQVKCPLSCPTSGSCDHNGGVVCSKYGDLKLTIPKGAIKDGDLIKFYIATNLYGPFVLPLKCQANVVSPYYWIGINGTYLFQKKIQVEFEHYGACDTSHYQLLSCEDDDESYTMRPVDHDLSFHVQDGISRCSFKTHHCCSYCLNHKCEDPPMNKIAAICLKTKNFQSSQQFATAVRFIFLTSLCLKRNEELYKQDDMVLDKNCC